MYRVVVDGWRATFRHLYPQVNGFESAASPGTHESGMLLLLVLSACDMDSIAYGWQAMKRCLAIILVPFLPLAS